MDSGGAEECVDLSAESGGVDVEVGRRVAGPPVKAIVDLKVERAEDRLLLEIGEDHGVEVKFLHSLQASGFGSSRGKSAPADSERVHAQGIVIILQGETDLLEVVGATDPPRGLSGRLNGRQQQRDQDGDDRDHHQELDQCETRTPHFHDCLLRRPRVDTRSTGAALSTRDEFGCVVRPSSHESFPPILNRQGTPRPDRTCPINFARAVLCHGRDPRVIPLQVTESCVAEP